MITTRIGVGDQSLVDGWVLVGKVLAPIGVRGEVKIEVHSGVSHRYSPSAVVYIDGSPFQVLSCRATPRALVVRFDGVDSRAAAESLRGKIICVPESDVPKLPEDTYYHYEVLGMRVFTKDGEDLGSVTEILVTGANDVFVVSGDRGETLIPALAGVVAGVDVKNSRLTVDLPETL
ncbi:MAG: 16S rRNA processing protein RimM [Dehalococcoidia bacterium]|nr:16S rRNA processing protein RimM [Dehalococcoidia bacterium]